MSRQSIVCFARLRDPSLFDTLEFYREDIEILRDLGHDVRAEHRRWAAARQEGDLLYAWWGGTALPVIVAWRLRGRRCILLGAIGFRDYDGQPLRRLVRCSAILLSSALATRTLAVSAYELADLRRFRAPRTSLAYHSVDTEYYVPGRKAPTPRGVTVGQVSAVSLERKGIELALAATPLVRRSLPDYELDVVGPISDEFHRWLAGAGRRYDLSGVHFHGLLPRHDKRLQLQRGWVYLQPSRYEAFGVAMVEAMASGTVPVYTDGGALPEIAGDGGVRVDRRDVEQLAEAIVDLLEDPVARHRLELRARERALTFSRDRRRAALSALLSDVTVPTGAER